MEPRKIYERRDDMAQGKLRLLMEEDGDIIIVLLGMNPNTKLYDKMIDIQFCTVGSGGGRSPETRKALRALAEAIEKDNMECPLLDPNEQK